MYHGPFFLTTLCYMLYILLKGEWECLVCFFTWYQSEGDCSITVQGTREQLDYLTWVTSEILFPV